MSKYNSKKVVVNEITFDSEVEAKYYTDVLIPMLDKGIINGFKVHPTYELIPAFEKNNKKHARITYIADFEVEFDEGILVIDIKGMPTEVANIKRKLFEYKYPYKLNWLCYSKIDGGWIAYEDLQKARKKRKKARVKK